MYGCYSYLPLPAELDRSFLLDDKARGLITREGLCTLSAGLLPPLATRSPPTLRPVTADQLLPCGLGDQDVHPPRALSADLEDAKSVPARGFP